MSGDGSDHSVSHESSRSKSLGSTEELSQCGTFSNPDAEAKQSTTGSSSSIRSKVSDSPGSTLTNEFALKTLGSLENIIGHGDGPLDVINAIDIAQQEDDLPFIAEGDDVVIKISKHGIQISSVTLGYCIRRVPLHEIERLVTYDDGIMGNTILAIKTGKLTYDENNCNLHIYQCPSIEVGQKITRSFSHVVASVLSSNPSDEVTMEIKDTT